MRTAAALRGARDARAAATRLRGCGPPARAPPALCVARQHTPLPPWAPEVPAWQGSGRRVLRGSAVGSRGRGPLGLGEARAGGAPRVTLVDRGSSDRRRPGRLAKKAGSVRRLARPDLRPLPSLRGRGPPVGVPWPPLRQRGGAGARRVIGPAVGVAGGARGAGRRMGSLFASGIVCPVGVLAPGTA